MDKFHLKNKHLLTLIATMVLAVFISTWFSIWSLYQEAYEQESDLLVQQVRAEKELIAAVGRFDAMNSRHAHDGGSIGSTLSQVIEAHENFWPTHESGALSLVELFTESEYAPVLISNHTETWYTNRYGLNGTEITTPDWLKESLPLIGDKVSGTLETSGALVAFERFEISTQHFLYIAKVDTEETRAPFIRAALISIGLAFITVLLGSLRFIRTVNPLLDQLEGQATLNKAILNTANNPIITIDCSGKIQSFNQSAVTLFQYSDNEIIGKSFSALFPDINNNFSIAQIDNENYQLVNDGGEFSGKKSNGETFPIQASFSLVNVLNKTLYVGIFTDLTEKKLAELVIRDNLARTHAIVDTVKDCIITIDESGSVLSMNPAGEKIFGYYIGEVEGQNISMLMPSELVDQHRRGMQRYLIDNQSELIGQVTELTAKRKGGDTFPIEVSIADVFISGNRMFVGVVRDISDRKEAEHELTQHRDHLKDMVAMATMEINAIVQTAVNGVISIDEKGIISLFNPAAEHLFGWRADEVIGENVALLMNSTSTAEHDSYLQRYIDTHKKNIIGISREIVARRKDGSTFPAQLAVGHSELKENQHLFVAYITDITEQKEAEAQLLTAKENAEAAAKTKANFLANMSHEIRTPMNAIIGFAEVILQDKQLQGATKQHIQTIYSAGKNLLSIINDVLDFSKIEAGKVELENVSFHLTNAIKDMLRTIEHKAKEKNLQINFVINDDLVLTRLGDPSRLRQVILNIVGNSIKFTQQGQITLTVANTEDDEVIKFSITDTGIGMTPEQVEKVFESFSQADTSTSRRFGGTGLGTTISKQIVNLMHGNIWVESEYGIGSTFHFTAKLPKSNDIENCLYLSSTAIEDDYISPRCFNILLAEDIQANATLAILRLEQMGHTVTWANNGLRVLDNYQANDFDLILMDIQMPELDGIATTLEIRKLENTNKTQIPIIALTASVMREDRNQCFQAGMNAIVGKPIDFSQLFTEMENVVAEGRGKVNELHVSTSTQSDCVDLTPISSIADISQGMKVWRDSVVYAKALLEFANSHGNDAKKLSEHINESPDDIDYARRISHTLKGVSGNLSLSNIAKTTSHLDQLLRNEMDADTMYYIGQLIDEIDTACQCIHLLKLPQAEATALKPYDHIEVSKLITQLKASIKQLNPEISEPIIQQLCEYITDSDIKPITRHIENFDFDLALSETEKLQQKLNVVCKD